MARYFFSLSISLSSYLFFSISFLHLASTAPVIQPAETQNLTEDASLAPVCVRDSNWLGTRYGPSDCHYAFEDFIEHEVQVHGDQEYEFLAPQAQPIHAIPIMQTPRRYTRVTCSLVIAMISSPFFPSGAIPNLPPGPYYSADVSSFREIAHAAQAVNNRCIKSAVAPPRQCAGYIRVGGRESIGVFIWGTFSRINHEVGPAVNGIGVNITVTAEAFVTGLERNRTLVESS